MVCQAVFKACLAISGTPIWGFLLFLVAYLLFAGCSAGLHSSCCAFRMGYRPIFYLWSWSMSSIQQKLIDLLDPVAESLGCELWGIDYSSQGRHAMLRIYIDKVGGVSLEDCEKISRQSSSVLDVEDPIKSEYTLEVSSPGMDRPLYKLPHYEQSIGERIQVRLRLPFDGRRRFTGLLKSVENEEIVLEVDNEEYVLPIESIDRANVTPQF